MSHNLRFSPAKYEESYFIIQEEEIGGVDFCQKFKNLKEAIQSIKPLENHLRVQWEPLKPRCWMLRRQCEVGVECQ